MTTPAGWYDDGAGSTRYWDGTAWTAHVAPAAAPPPVVPEPVAPQPVVPEPAAPQAPAPQVPAPQPAQQPAPQQAYAQAAYSSQPPIPKASGSKLPLIIGLGVGAIVLGVGAFFGLTMLLGGEKGPREAFESYYSAAERGDCEGVYEMTVESVDGPPASEYCEGSEYEPFGDADYSISIDDVEENGDTANVTVSVTYQDEYMEEPATETSTFVFERIDGRWLFSTLDYS